MLGQSNHPVLLVAQCRVPAGLSPSVQLSGAGGSSSGQTTARNKLPGLWREAEWQWHCFIGLGYKYFRICQSDNLALTRQTGEWWLWFGGRRLLPVEAGEGDWDHGQWREVKTEEVLTREWGGAVKGWSSNTRTVTASDLGYPIKSLRPPASPVLTVGRCFFPATALQYWWS